MAIGHMRYPGQAQIIDDVFDAVKSRMEAMSTKTIREIVSKRRTGVSVHTVYESLKRLKSKGLVTNIKLSDNTVMWSFIWDAVADED